LLTSHTVLTLHQFGGRIYQKCLDTTLPRLLASSHWSMGLWLADTHGCTCVHFQDFGDDETKKMMPLASRFYCTVCVHR